jgi:hypothetical protein
LVRANAEIQVIRRRFRLFTSIGLIATAIGGGGFIGTTSAYASAKSVALANDFNFFCMRGSPTYESINAYAASLKLTTKQDLSSELGHGNRVRSRSWVVGDNTGPYELVAGEAVNGDVVAETCGIGSADGNGGEIYSEFNAHSRLGTPHESRSSDYRFETVVWVLSPNEKLLLRYAVTGPGFYLTRLIKSSRGR